jgi:hypothetical protein
MRFGIGVFLAFDFQDNGLCHYCFDSEGTSDRSTLMNPFTMVIAPKAPKNQLCCLMACQMNTPPSAKNMKAMNR